MTNIVQTKKRDGRLVPFDPSRISSAINKSFIAVRGGADDELLNKITQSVIENLDKFYGEEGIAPVEHIQNIVEKVMMENNCFDVAKAYIIYRYEHAKTRDKKHTPTEEPTTESVEMPAFQTTDAVQKSFSLEFRSDDSRFGALLDLLAENQIITQEQKKEILSQEPAIRLK
ncbi:hypothetical protein KKA94_02535 [Patescibacteria group bacterium]|nr:hypothetical protein [Patescibacteria group bacterium]